MIKEKLKKHKFSLIVMLIIAVFLTAGYGVISSRADAVSENPVQQINEKRSKVLVSGEKYALNDKQDRQYQKEQKQKEKQIKKEEQQKKEDPFQQRLEETVQQSEEGEQKESNTGEVSGSGDENQGGSGESDVEIPKDEETPPDEPFEPSDEEEGSKSPVIITSLTDGQIVDGLRLVFSVEGRDYLGYKIESFNFDIKVNGIKIYSSGENTYKRSYRADLEDGGNDIEITIRDNDGNSVTNYYKVYGNKDGHPEEGGTVTVTLDTRVLGLGYKFVDTSAFYDGDNVADVVIRALKNNGYDYRTGDSGGVAYGFYLKYILKPGITSGFDIPDPIQEKLDDMGATEKGHSDDSLGEKDFYQNSGWMYTLNGESPSGMSNYNVNDGDEIVIYFTLNMGFEYDGTWFYGNW